MMMMMMMIIIFRMKMMKITLIVFMDPKHVIVRLIIVIMVL